MTTQAAHQPSMPPSTVQARAAGADAPRTQPRLLAHHEAQRSPDPAARLMAQALRTMTGLVPSDVAFFWSITRRIEIGDGIVLRHAAPNKTPIDAGFCGGRHRADDPFAPIVAARRGASLLTIEDVGGALRVGTSGHGRDLGRAGLEHEVALYLRSAGVLSGMIALFRAQRTRPFDSREVRVLRELQPLVEQAQARDLGPHLAPESAQDLPALTRREAEVAALIALGASNAEIGTALSVEESTVKTHLTQIYAKFGVRSRIQLAIRLNAEAVPATATF